MERPAPLRKDFQAAGRAYICVDGEARHRDDRDKLERHSQTLSASAQRLFQARVVEKFIFQQKIYLISDPENFNSEFSEISPTMRTSTLGNKRQIS